MTQFDKLALTRRGALKAGLAGVVASGAMFGVTSAAFADDTLAEIKKRGVLSTATEMQFPPFDISDNGTYKGLNRDLVDAVGKQMGLKVPIFDLPWTSILPRLEAKKFDLCIAPVTITKERMKHYAFTVPIADATAALMKRAERQEPHEAEDIAGRTVGGSEGHLAARAAQGVCGQIAEAGRGQGICRQQPVLRRPCGWADRRLGQFAAEPRLRRPAALRHVCDGGAAVGQPTYFSWVGRSTTRR